MNNSLLKPMSTQDHNRLIELQQLMNLNGMSAMTTKEFCEYVELFAQSLAGKGDAPIMITNQKQNENQNLQRFTSGISR